MLDKARNDLSAAVPKFCLALEEHRRTPDGRVRTSQELLTSFFPHDEKVCTDKLFKYLPNEVRGPIIAAWGIRGIKAALRDDDERIQQVVYDALVAGDVDHSAFEEGLTPETLVRWVPLGDLWAFWRGGKLTKQAIHKALSTAYELYLFDARWFLDALHSKGGALKGTNVLSDGLTKDELTQWIHRIHETADGTPKGLVAALGWDKIVTKTPNDVLVGVLDAMVTKVGLVTAPGREPPRESTPKLPEAPAKAEPKPEPPAAAVAASVPPAEPPKPPPVPGEAKLEPLRATDKPPGPDDVSWSAVPPPPEPGGGLSMDDGINVVVEEEVVIADRGGPPTAPRMRAASPTGTIDEEDTEVKQVARRSERPARGGTPPRR
ncbi:MAG TPA: hypothetical protein VGL81_14880 [Polyangiaceae bacterium]